MHRKFGYCWVEFTSSIDLMDWSSSVYINFRKIKQTTSRYDHIDHLMVDLETIIALCDIYCRLKCL